MFNFLKRRISSPIVSTVFVASLMLLSSCGNSSSDKAEEFMQAGMYDQAKAVLEQEIMNSPTNSEAHLLLGMCELALANPHGAEESFKRAVQVNPKIGGSIGQRLFELAENLHPSDRAEEAYRILRTAVRYDPALKTESARYYLQLAQEQESASETLRLVEGALAFDEEIKPEAAKLLFDRGKALLPDELQSGGQLLEKAMEYDPSLKAELAHHLLELGREQQSISQAATLLRGAQSMDNGLRSEACNILMSKIEASASNADFDELQKAVVTAVSIDQAYAEKGAQLLLAKFGETGRAMSEGESRKAITAILDIDAGSASAVGNTLLDFAEADINDGRLAVALEQAKAAIGPALGSGSNKARSKDIFVSISNKAIATDESVFANGMEILIKNYPSVTQSSSKKELYLYGAHLWRKGAKSQAVKILRQVPDDDGRLGIEFAKTRIPPGRYPVNRPKKDDFGWGTFTFTLEAIEVKPDHSLEVHIRVRNHTNSNQHFLYAQGKNERFYIIDDLGKSSTSPPPHFVNVAGYDDFNNTNDAIVMRPGVEITEKLKFPAPSVGTTTISFVSPKHNGHQWEIKYGNIVLRHVKFQSWQ